MKKQSVLWISAACLLLSVIIGSGELITDDLAVMGKAVISGELNVSPLPEGAALPTDGLILHYSFDSDEGGVITDESGNGRNASVNGATHIANGKVGGAYEFDGVNDSIVTTENLGINVSQPRTLSCWVKADANSQDYYIMGHGDISWTRGSWLNLWVSRFRFLGISCDAFGAPPRDVGTWYHLVGTYTLGTIKLYVNGELDAINTNAGWNTDATPLYIGMRNNNSCYFDGIIDEVRVYDRALSQMEITALYEDRGEDPPDPKVILNTGVHYVAPLGDLSMGSYTEAPAE